MDDQQRKRHVMVNTQPLNDENRVYFTFYKRSQKITPEIEKEMFEKTINECEFYFRTQRKDFIIKNVISSNSDSLFPDETELKEYGFNFLITLKTEDNGKLVIEAKGRNKAQELVERIKELLNKKPTIDWNDIKNIPFTNSKIEKFIDEKKE